ncbi:MAG: twin transmembrane helix small protein [Pseudomonadota bacterium]
MSGTFFYLALAGCLVTAIVLMIGIIGFGTGKASAAFSNKMMRLRVLAQFVAVVLMMITVWLAQSGQ